MTAMTKGMVGALPVWARVALVVGGAMLSGGCASGPAELNGEIMPAEYFQRGQEATANQDYAGAMEWYAAFRERYADDESPGQKNLLLWAEYEVAFLHHKMGDDRTAVRLLRELVDRYETPEAVTYDPAPRILALRVISELEPQAPTGN